LRAKEEELLIEETSKKIGVNPDGFSFFFSLPTNHCYVREKRIKINLKIKNTYKRTERFREAPRIWREIPTWRMEPFGTSKEKLNF